MHLLSRRPLAVFCALLILIGALQILTIRPGQTWGDDFAMYILHARNIATGRAYADTGYIYNPANARVGPPSYPPLFPAVLAVVYRARGLDPGAMQLLNVAFFLGYLAIISPLLSGRLSFPWILAIIGLIGFSPYYSQFKSQILSDLLFGFLVLLTLTTASRIFSMRWTGIAPVIVLGVLAAACFETRTAGVIVIACLAPYHFFVTRNPRSTLLLIGVWMVLVFLTAQFVPSTRAYLDQLHVSRAVVAHNVRMYQWQVRTYLWGNGGMSWIGGLLLTAFLVLAAAWGYVIRARKGFSFHEFFLPPYLIMIALWPTEVDLRFLIPVIPLWLYYVCVALQRLPRAVSWAALAAILLSYSGGWAASKFGPLEGAFGHPDFESLCAYIKARTDPRASFLFLKPRALALRTSRSASVYAVNSNCDVLWAYARRIRSRYIIVSTFFEEDLALLEPCVNRHTSELQPEFENQGFRLLRVLRTD